MRLGGRSLRWVLFWGLSSGLFWEERPPAFPFSSTDLPLESLEPSEFFIGILHALRLADLLLREAQIHEIYIHQT